MINAEMVENPVLEELEDAVPLHRRRRAQGRRSATASQRGDRRKSVTAAERPRTLSKKSISARSSRNTSTPAIAAKARWKKSSGHRSRTSFQARNSDRPPDLAAWRHVGEASECAKPPKLVIGNLQRRRIPDCQRRRAAWESLPPASPEADAVTQQNVVKEAAALRPICHRDRNRN